MLQVNVTLYLAYLIKHQLNIHHPVSLIFSHFSLALEEKKNTNTF